MKHKKVTKERGMSVTKKNERHKGYKREWRTQSLQSEWEVQRLQKWGSSTKITTKKPVRGMKVTEESERHEGYKREHEAQSEWELQSLQNELEAQKVTKQWKMMVTRGNKRHQGHKREWGTTFTKESEAYNDYNGGWEAQRL